MGRPALSSTSPPSPPRTGQTRPSVGLIEVSRLVAPIQVVERRKSKLQAKPSLSLMGCTKLSRACLNRQIYVNIKSRDSYRITVPFLEALDNVLNVPRII